MIMTLDEMSDLGILGLRRKDLIESPYHPDPWYQSMFRDFLLSSGETALLEMVNHVMGTFTMYNKTTTKPFGYLYQMQDEGNVYGLDDSLACYRMMALGFKRAFLRGWDDVLIEIDHVDPGEGDGSDEWNAKYTLWKQQQAAKWMPRYKEIANEYIKGIRSPRYEATWDFRQIERHLTQVVV